MTREQVPGSIWTMSSSCEGSASSTRQSSNASIPTGLGVGGPAKETAPSVPMPVAAATALYAPRHARGEGALGGSGRDPLSQHGRPRREGQLLVEVVLGRAESPNELGGIGPEASRNLQQVVEVQVAAASLDLTEEGPVDPALMSQGLLAEAEGFSVCSDTLAESAGGRRDRVSHRPNDIRLDCSCPEQPCPMRLCPAPTGPCYYPPS